MVSLFITWPEMMVETQSEIISSPLDFRVKDNIQT